MSDNGDTVTEEKDDRIEPKETEEEITKSHETEVDKQPADAIESKDDEESATKNETDEASAEPEAVTKSNEQNEADAVQESGPVEAVEPVGDQEEAVESKENVEVGTTEVGVEETLKLEESGVAVPETGEEVAAGEPVPQEEGGEASPKAEGNEDATREEGTEEQPEGVSKEGDKTTTDEGDTNTAEEGVEATEEGEKTAEEGEKTAEEGEKTAEEGEKTGEEGGEVKEVVEGEDGDEKKQPEGEEGVPVDEVKEGEEEPSEQPEEHLAVIAEGADDDETSAKIDAAFEEDGRAKSGLHAGEILDEQDVIAEGEHDRPELVGSPHEQYMEESEHEDEYEEEEEEEEEIYIDREALEKKYKQAISDRKLLHEQNNILQNKLAEYFRKKKADSEAAGGKLEVEKSSSEYEQRYIKYMSSLEDLKRQYANLQEDYQQESEELKEQSQIKQEEVDKERLRFMEYKKQIGIKSVNSRSGRTIPAKDLDVLLANEQKKESDVLAVRLENIKLQNRLTKEETALKSKEELAEGLYMIDFEQLKLENQTYNEKIEERNEELLKLRKKITSTVQVLTHLKEKLQFVKQENQTQRSGLAEVDAVLAKRRDLLSRTKQQRDSLRSGNTRLRQNCGMLGNEMLLRDMETCVDKVSERKTHLERMRMEHAELSLKTNGLRRKIEQSKSTDAI